MCLRIYEVIPEEDGAAQVADLAFNHNHPTALKAVDLFVQIYGAYAGSLALAGLSRGGRVYCGRNRAAAHRQAEGWRIHDGLLQQGTLCRLNGKNPGLCGRQFESRAARRGSGSPPHVFTQLAGLAMRLTLSSVHSAQFVTQSGDGRQRRTNVQCLEHKSVLA